MEESDFIWPPLGQERDSPAGAPRRAPPLGCHLGRSLLSGIPAICRSRSELCGRIPEVLASPDRLAIGRFQVPSPIGTPPPVPQTLASSSWVPAVVASSESKLAPSARTELDVDGHQHLITWFPRPRILANLSPVPSRRGGHSTNDKREIALDICKWPLTVTLDMTVSSRIS